MKKLTSIFAFLVLGTSYVKAQCFQQFDCNNATTITLPTNVNINNIPGNKCFQTASIPYGIPNNVNLNFHIMSLKGEISVLQTVNMNNNSMEKIYIQDNSHGIFMNMNMNSGNDTIFVGENSKLTIVSLGLNNTNNKVIYLAATARLFLNNVIEYTDSSYYHSLLPFHPQYNNYKVKIIKCGSTVLPLSKFKLDGEYIDFELTDFANYELQYSEDARNYKTIYKDFGKQNRIKIENNGYYRLYFEGTYSYVIKYFSAKNQLKNDLIYDLLGKPVSNPQKGVIYIQNNKKFLLL